MAKIININSVKNTVKNTVKHTTLAASVAAMCINMGLNAQETEAAKAAMHDIAQEEGGRAARAIIVDMQNDHDPFGGFYA